jgi:hypothetical protein
MEDEAMKLLVRNLTVLLVVVSALVAILYARARAQVVTPRPGDLRYEALLTQPIATAERQSVVAGASALLIKDRASGQCFLAVMIGNSVGLSPATCG